MVFNFLQKKIFQNGPQLLSTPLNYVPFFIKQHVIESWLSWQFNHYLLEGELDFLIDHWLKIKITDLGLSWYMTNRDNKLVVSEYESADAIFRGHANDFILIAARKEDPDTLFFQRRLSVEGNTELSLYVKNLMDAIDFDNIPTPIRVALLKAADMIEKEKHANDTI